MCAARVFDCRLYIKKKNNEKRDHTLTYAHTDGAVFAYYYYLLIDLYSSRRERRLILRLKRSRVVWESSNRFRVCMRFSPTRNTRVQRHS